MLQRPRAQNGAPDARVQQRIQVGVGAQPAAAFHRNTQRTRNLANDLQMRRTPLKSAIQIHHMQPFSALRLPLQGHRHRIRAINGHVIRTPLTQTDTLPALQVNRR